MSEYYYFHLPLLCEWENNEQSLVYSDIHTVTKVRSSPHLIGSVLALETLQEEEYSVHHTQVIYADYLPPPPCALVSHCTRHLSDGGVMIAEAKSCTCLFL